MRLGLGCCWIARSKAYPRVCIWEESEKAKAPLRVLLAGCQRPWSWGGGWGLHPNDSAIGRFGSRNDHDVL